MAEPRATVRRLLVATDGSAAALAALRMARTLAIPAATGVAVVAVTDRADADPTHLSARMDRRLALVQSQLATIDGAATTWPLETAVGEPAAEICRCASARGVDLVVVGLGRYAAGDRLLGSETALRVACRAAVPVLAVPADADARARVGVCGVSADAVLASATARAAAGLLAPDGVLHLAHVAPYAGACEACGARAHLAAAATAAAATRAADPLHVETGLLRGAPADALLALAREHGAGLIALGRRRGSAQADPDSTLARVFRGAECAVLVVPAPAA